jgi:hypothetical protein
METGISVYPGLGGTIQEKTARIERAAALGMTRLFTSFHIPETDPAAFRKELQAVLDTARQCQLDIVADVSPASAACLGMDRFDPEVIAKLGITTVRFDDGFDAAKLAMYSHIVRVQVNASTLTRKDLEDLRKNGAQLDHIDSLHNFYPRPHTGLALDYFKTQTDRLHACGLSVGAFVASQAGQRAPLYEGLPTLEFHRHQDVSLAARHLAALGVQSVFIGDDKPADKELRDLARAGREETDVVVIKAKLLSWEPHIQDLLSYTFTARPDPSRDVIRANGRTAASSNRTATSSAVSTAATSPWTTPISCVIWAKSRSSNVNCRRKSGPTSSPKSCRTKNFSSTISRRAGNSALNSSVSGSGPGQEDDRPQDTGHAGRPGQGQGFMENSNADDGRRQRFH